MDYRKSHINKDYDYHKLFHEDKRTKVIWEIEQTIIPQIINKYFTLPVEAHLDFACGTGRILNLLSRFTTTTTGVDVSESMTQLALKNKRSDNITIKIADITKEDVLEESKFNLITAFRFFPHAEKQLRDEVMGKLICHMNDESILVFNNHANLKSFRNLIVKIITFGEKGNWGYPFKEMVDLIDKHDLELIDYQGIGLIPFFENCPNFICKLLTKLELLFTRFKFFRKHCENIILICRKKSQLNINNPFR